MKAGDLVRTARYGTVYLVVSRRQDLDDTFIVHSVDGRIRQSLNSRYLEVISEGR